MPKKSTRKKGRRLKRLVPGGNQISKGVLPRPVHIVYEKVIEPRSSYTYLDWERGEQLPPYVRHLRPGAIVDPLPKLKPLNDETGQRLRADERWTGYRPPPNNSRGIALLTPSGPGHVDDVDMARRLQNAKEAQARADERRNAMDTSWDHGSGRRDNATGLQGRLTAREPVQIAPSSLARIAPMQKPRHKDISFPKSFSERVSMDVQTGTFDPMQVSREGGISGQVTNFDPLANEGGGAAVQLAPYVRTPPRNTMMRFLGQFRTPPPSGERPKKKGK